jgi:hypothetical protein
MNAAFERVVSAFSTWPHASSPIGSTPSQETHCEEEGGQRARETHGPGDDGAEAEAVGGGEVAVDRVHAVDALEGQCGRREKDVDPAALALDGEPRGRASVEPAQPVARGHGVFDRARPQRHQPIADLESRARGRASGGDLPDPEAAFSFAQAEAEIGSAGQGAGQPDLREDLSGHEAGPRAAAIQRAG